ncbi:MAG TPA: flavin reductase family protein [Solirubrobacteraceae bacterium]|nr:flavin reductase family protein [Solirubrobacteraceae bacterium]
MPGGLEAIELRERVRSVHRSFPSGVAVVTTATDGTPYGLAVNAFSSVSMDPPIVLVCVNTTARTHDPLYQGAHLGINFLAHDQVPIARRFATSGGNKFSGVTWHTGEDGVPLLDGASAYLVMEIQQRLAVATHTIFVGEVTAASAQRRAPLVYYAGVFFDGTELDLASLDDSG